MNKEAPEYLVQAYGVCCEIYDSEFETVRNPYIALLTNYTSHYFERLLGRTEPSQEDNERLLAYRHYAHLEEEMQTAYCKILRRAGRNTSVDFCRREAFLREGLNWAQTIRCPAEEIDALWDLHILYDGNTGAESDGQAELKAAFELAQRDSSYRETPGYCALLQVMIDFYKGELDKDTLYDQLRRITPGIYGSDARRVRIYRCLRNYAVRISDSRGTEYAVEVLRCEFDRYELEGVYNVYAQFADEAQFINALETVLRDMPELSEQCQKEVEAFLYTEDRSHPSPSDETDPADKAAGAEKKGKASRYSPEFCQKVQETVRRIQQEKKRTRYAHRRI